MAQKNLLFNQWTELLNKIEEGQRLVEQRVLIQQR